MIIYLIQMNRQIKRRLSIIASKLELLSSDHDGVNHGFASSNDLMNAVRSVLPESSMGKDNGGQVIIYTNLYVRDDGSLESMDFME